MTNNQKIGNNLCSLHIIKMQDIHILLFFFSPFFRWTRYFSNDVYGIVHTAHMKWQSFNLIIEDLFDPPEID